jgi:hypothetical protein
MKNKLISWFRRDKLIGLSVVESFPYKFRDSKSKAKSPFKNRTAWTNIKTPKQVVCIKMGGNDENYGINQESKISFCPFFLNKAGKNTKIATI